MWKLSLCVLLVMMTGSAAHAQVQSPVKWTSSAKRLKNNEVMLSLRATIQSGFHIYSMSVKSGGPVKTSFSFTPAKGYALVGKTTEPTPIAKFEEAFKMDVLYFENTVTFQQKIKLKAPAATAVKGTVEFMACDAHKCLPPEDVGFSIAIEP